MAHTHSLTLYMSSLLQVEDVRKSDTEEHDKEQANMKGRKKQERDGQGQMFSQVCERQHDCC